MLFSLLAMLMMMLPVGCFREGNGSKQNDSPSQTTKTIVVTKKKIKAAEPTLFSERIQNAK